MGGGKGGGQVTGYRYYLGMHIVGALAPIDGLMEMLGEKKLLWRGYRRDGQIKVKKGKAYGGEKKQGGFSGRIDLLTGDDTQGSNDYLEERFDAPEVGYRGVFSMVFRRPYIGANNPYLKPLKFKLKSVYRPYGDWLRGYAGVNGEFQNGGAQLFIALDNSLDFHSAGYRDTLHEAVRNWIKSMATGKASIKLVAFSDVVDDQIEVSGEFSENKQALLDWVDAIPLPAAKIGDLGGENDNVDGRYLYDLDISDVPVGGSFTFTDTVTVYFNVSTLVNRIVTARFLDSSGVELRTSQQNTNATPVAPSPNNFPRSFTFTKNSAAEAKLRVDVNVAPSRNAALLRQVVLTDPRLTVPYNSGSETLRIPLEDTVKVSNATATASDVPYTEGQVSFIANGWNQSNYDNLTLGGNPSSWSAAVASAPTFFSGGAGGDFAGFVTSSNLVELLGLNEEADSSDEKLKQRAVFFFSDGVPASSANADAAKSTLDGISKIERYAYNLGPQDTTQAEKIDTSGEVPNFDGADEHDVAKFEDDVMVSWMDVNPIHAGRDILVNRRTGGDGTASQIGETFAPVAKQMLDEGFGISPYGTVSDIDSVLQEIEETADVVFSFSPQTGAYEVAAIRDDYDEGDIITIDSSIVEDWGDISRPLPDDLPNAVTVVFTKREDGSTRSLGVHNVASLSSGGRIIPEKVQRPFVTYPPLAQRVALREMSTATVPLWAGSGLRLAYLPDGLEIGSPFIINQPKLGLNNVTARLLEFELDDSDQSGVVIKWTEDGFSTDDDQGPITDGPLGADTLDALPPDMVMVEESPYYLAVQDRGQAEVDTQLETNPDGGAMIATASRVDDIHLAAFIAEDQAGEWAQIGEAGLSPYSTLDAALTSRADDVTVTVPFNDSLTRVLPDTLCKIGPEICRVDNMVQVDSTVTVTLGRGVLDTVPVAHTAGDGILFFGGNFGTDNVERFDGESVTVRILPYTSAEILDPADTTDQTLTFASRMIRPYPAGDLQADGDYQQTDAVFDGSVSLTWAHRDRTAQTTAVPEVFSDPDVGPEAGVTYRVRARAYDSEGADLGVFYDVDVGTSTSATFNDTTGAPLGTARIGLSVLSERDGYEAWQEAEIIYLLDAVLLDQEGEAMTDQDGDTILRN